MKHWSGSCMRCWETISQRSQLVGPSKTTIWRILQKDWALKAYKVQKPQQLKPLDHLKKISTVTLFFEMVMWIGHHDHVIWHPGTIFSDENRNYVKMFQQIIVCQLLFFVNKANCVLLKIKKPHNLKAPKKKRY